MTATELFTAGRLRAAIESQTGAVSAAPNDRSARLFLFELLAFAGDLDRARRHLDLLRYDEPEHASAVEQLRHMLDAEERRRAVFAGTRSPKCLGAAPDHLLLRLEALPYLARGEHADARWLLDQANALAPTVRGTLNGGAFAGLCDTDERFGTVLEVFGTDGTYNWVTLEQVASITLGAPQSSRDVLWRAGRLSLVNGPEGCVVFPGLYPGTHDHPDDEVKLGRATEWLGADGEVARGAGGRAFLTGNAVIRFVEMAHLRRSA